MVYSVCTQFVLVRVIIIWWFQECYKCNIFSQLESMLLSTDNTYIERMRTLDRVKTNAKQLPDLSVTYKYISFYSLLIIYILKFNNLLKSHIKTWAYNFTFKIFFHRNRDVTWLSRSEGIKLWHCQLNVHKNYVKMDFGHCIQSTCSQSLEELRLFSSRHVALGCPLLGIQK